MLGQICGANSGQIFAALKGRRHFFHDGNQTIDLEIGLGRGQATHFMFHFDLDPLPNTIEHVLLGGRSAFGDLDVVDILHVLEIADIQAGDQGDGDTRLASASGPPSPVDIDFGCIGGRVADDMGQIADIDASSRDVGGDEELQLSGFDSFERSLPGSLSEIA